MDNRKKGIICIVLSAFCFALMNTFIRLSGDLPSIQKAFFRNLVALIFAFIIIKRNHVKMGWKKGDGKFLFLRASFGTFGIICNFYAVDHLVLSDASMLNKMSPFFAIVFSFFILKEKVSFKEFSRVIIAFVGCIFIVKPTFSNLNLTASLAGLLGGMGAGIAYTMVRILGKREVKGPFIVFFFSTFSCLVVLPYLLFYYEPMTGKQILYLLLAGLFATGGQFGVTSAYCYAPAKEIGVYDYSQVVFAALIGFLLFGQIPDILSLLGYVLICIAAISMFFYQKNNVAKS